MWSPNVSLYLFLPKNVLTVFGVSPIQMFVFPSRVVVCSGFFSVRAAHTSIFYGTNLHRQESLVRPYAVFVLVCLKVNSPLAALQSFADGASLVNGDCHTHKLPSSRQARRLIKLSLAVSRSILP